MNKKQLIRFVDKYNLGGAINAVNWKINATDKTLMSRGELQAKTFTADVTLKGFEEIAEDVRIPIADSIKFKDSFHHFLNDDVKLELNKNGDRVLGINITDTDCWGYFAAADPSAIPPVTKNLEDKHIYDVEIALTDEFVEMVSRASNKMDEVSDITVRMNKKNQVEFMIGFPVANTTRVGVIAPTINGKDSFSGKPLKFPTKNIIEVMKANKEIPDGVLYLRADGVIRMIYNSDEFRTQYWQFANIK